MLGRAVGGSQVVETAAFNDSDEVDVDEVVPGRVADDAPDAGPMAVVGADRAEGVRRCRQLGAREETCRVACGNAAGGDHFWRDARAAAACGRVFLGPVRREMIGQGTGLDALPFVRVVRQYIETATRPAQEGMWISFASEEAEARAVELEVDRLRNVVALVAELRTGVAWLVRVVAPGIAHADFVLSGHDMTVPVAHASDTVHAAAERAPQRPVVPRGEYATAALHVRIEHTQLGVAQPARRILRLMRIAEVVGGAVEVRLDAEQPDLVILRVGEMCRMVEPEILHACGNAGRACHDSRVGDVAAQMSQRDVEPHVAAAVVHQQIDERREPEIPEAEIETAVGDEQDAHGTGPPPREDDGRVDAVQILAQLHVIYQPKLETVD